MFVGGVSYVHFREEQHEMQVELELINNYYLVQVELFRRKVKVDFTDSNVTMSE